jgi:hypothetical protein
MNRTPTGRVVGSLVMSSTVCLALALVTVLRAQATPGQAGAQGPPAPTGPMAPEKYKDIQVLTDVPADQLDVTMRYFVAATGIQCAGCHFRDATTNEVIFDRDARGKSTARQMIGLVKTVNAGTFGVRINCGTCHAGRNQPAGLQPAQMMTDTEIAAMAAQMAAQAARDAAGPGADRGAAPPQAGPGGRGNQPPPPPVDDVINKYLDALGGQAALAKLTSRVITGTVTNRMKQSVAFTIEEKADKFHESIALSPAPLAFGFDGAAGWIQTGDHASDLTGFPLQMVLRMADLGLPLHLKDRYTTVTATRPSRLPAATPGAQGIAVNVLQCQTPAQYLTDSLYLDATTGLLLRRRIVTRTGLNGSLVEQFDYADYRDVNGVKMPFEITHSTWNLLDTFKVAGIKANTNISDGTFVKPGR